MNLQRYTPNIGPSEPAMAESPSGAWVKYEDAMELLQAHHKAVEAVTELFNFTVNGDAVLRLSSIVEGLRTALRAERGKTAAAKNACLAVLGAVEDTDLPVDGRRLAYALLEVLRGHEVAGVLQHHDIFPDEGGGAL